MKQSTQHIMLAVVIVSTIVIGGVFIAINTYPTDNHGVDYPIRTWGFGE